MVVDQLVEMIDVVLDLILVRDMSQAVFSSDESLQLAHTSLSVKPDAERHDEPPIPSFAYGQTNDDDAIQKSDAYCLRPSLKSSSSRHHAPTTPSLSLTHKRERPEDSTALPSTGASLVT